MKRRFTILTAALALLTFLAVPMGMWGQNRDTKTDIMFAKGFAGYTTGSFSAAGTDRSAVANSTNATGVTYAMQVFNGSTGAVRGNQSGASNYSCRNTTTYDGYYISSVSLTITSTGGGTLDGSTNGRSIVYFGSSAYANPNTTAPSGTATVASPNQSGQTTLTWTNTDESVSHFILYNLKTSGTVLSASSSSPLTVVWTQKTGPSIPSTTLTIDDANLTNTDVYTSTDAGWLSATVKAGTVTISNPSISWESSDEDVATIDEDGVVTLVAAGTVTITASYAGEPNVYGPSSSEYTFIVEDSTPFAGGVVTFVAGTDKGSTSSQGADEMTKSGVTVSSTSAALATSEYRFYQGSTTTISTTTGSITRIEFTEASSSYPISRLSTTTGTFQNGVWTGDASSIEFVASSQARASQIAVTVTVSSGVATTTTINVPANFNTDIYTSTTPGTLTATVSAEGSTISGASVTWSSSNTGVATIDANGAVTLVGVGTTNITASYAGVENVYRPSEATYELTVINSNAPGSVNNPYTVAQAIANTPSSGTSSNVYIHGIVSAFWNNNATILGDNSHRYYISDDGGTTTQLLVYNGKGLNNVAFSNASDLQIGDEVTILGGLMMYQSAPEVAANNYIVSLVRRPSITVDAANNSLAIPDQVLGDYDETGFATLTVSGSNLTDGITLTLGANSAFEMSTDLENWSSTITIPQSNGSITDEEVVIRLKETLSVVQQYTDNITLTSTGADNVVVAISGSLTNQTYTIEQYSTPATAHGTITFAYDGPLYEGTTVTMTATPADGYEFTANSWVFYNADEVEEVSLTVTDGNKINMPAYNLAVDASFAEKVKYTITSVVTPANSGTIVTDNEAWEGKVVEVAVEAEDGYAFSSIVVCKTGDTNTTINVSGDVTNGFTFTMPAYAVTVTATFVVNLDVTYDFSTADNFYTTAGGSTHPATGSSNNISEFYYGNGDMFTASGTSYYFGSTSSPYFLFGKEGALVNLPTFAGYKVTQIIIHSSTTHSTSVNVAIVSGENTVAGEQTWSTKDRDYTYVIPEQYQTSALSVKVTNDKNAQFTSITLVREYRTYTLEIAGYSGTKDHYYLIASPVTVDPATVGMTTGNFDLYYFNQAETDEWRNYENASFNLVPGTGYLYAMEGANQTFNFTLTGAPYSGDGIIPLTNTTGADFEGWNLVGNPYGVEAEISMDYYEMNSDGTGLIAGEDYIIDAMQGVFVQYTVNDQEVMFLPIEIGTVSGGESKLALNLTKGRGVIDRAIVRFGEGRQLPKFQLNPDDTKVYVTEGNQDYAIVRSNNAGEMPVNFKAAENGNYTLSVEAENVEASYLHLIDNMTGADVDLLATPSYSFEARTTDYANRFRLVFNATGVDENNATASFAYFNGSSWTIDNMGEATLQVVDMMGRVLSSETISGNVSISLNQPAGVYMLRLVNGENVMVQKVVVR